MCKGTAGDGLLGATVAVCKGAFAWEFRNRRSRLTARMVELRRRCSKGVNMEVR